MIQEEQNVLYVALTRSKNAMYLVGSRECLLSDKLRVNPLILFGLNNILNYPSKDVNLSSSFNNMKISEKTVKK